MKIFKDMMVEGANIPVGTWVMSGSPVVTEVLACSGYDFLVLDAEHGLSSQESLLHQTQTAELHGVCPIIRCADHDSTRIKQLLDVIGAQTLMFPMVESASDAEGLVRSSRYSPAGERGFAKMIRASQFGQAGYVGKAAERLTLIAQLETEEAMHRALEIGSVEGIDAVFIGPGDLSMNMGVADCMQDTDFKGFIGETVRLCRAQGICVGTVMPTPELARWFAQEGGNFIAIGGDLGFLFSASRTQIGALRQSQ